MKSSRTRNMFNAIGVAPPSLRRENKSSGNSLENCCNVDCELQNNNLALWLSNQYDEAVTHSPNSNHWSCEKENRPIVDEVCINAETLNPVTSNSCLRLSSSNLTPNISAIKSFDVNPLQEIQNDSDVIDDSYENDVVAQTSTQITSYIASPSSSKVTLNILSA